jgi:hypothetical protein
LKVIQSHSLAVFCTKQEEKKNHIALNAKEWPNYLVCAFFLCNFFFFYIIHDLALLCSWDYYVVHDAQDPNNYTHPPLTEGWRGGTHSFSTPMLGVKVAEADSAIHSLVEWVKRGIYPIP